MTSIENRILNIIKRENGILAKDIGYEVGLSRKEVNHYLYGSLDPFVWQDTEYRWYSVVEKPIEEDRSDFDLTKEEALKKYFGYDSFRGYQGDIIDDVLDGKDVLAILPTGSGKSVCYQIPALITRGVVIVISPLKALMKDQVDTLKNQYGIKAATINSSQSQEENEAVIEEYKKGEVWILYLSPERLQKDLYDYLQDMQITLFAIDEAHCISQWGHDFREDYTNLNIIKDECPDVPILALTATANSLTRNDIMEQLQIEDAEEYIDSFDRPEIYIEVRKGLHKEQKVKAVAKLYYQYRESPGIVYCQTRRKAASFAKCLQEIGIPAEFYHAGMDDERRAEVQDAFMNGEVKVICATIAFGMGVNKKDVRWVAHANMSNCLESYYQEIGRAGRDKLKCHAVMFYNPSDEELPRKWADESWNPSLNHKRINDMVAFVNTKKCRRKFVLNYFEEKYSRSKCYHCDNCK